MKKLLLVAAVIFCFQAEGQTLLNLAWRSHTGHPTLAYDYIASMKDASGNVYYIGNTYHLGEQENYLISKYQANGALVWQQEYNSITGDRDFGADIYIKDTYVYVAGTSWDSAGAFSQFWTLQLLQSDGSLVWDAHHNINGGLDIATAIKADESGNVYVAGTTEKGAGLYEMAVVKYDNSGSLLWDNTYSDTGAYNGSVAMLYDDVKDVIQVTGYTGGAFNAWAILTVEFDGTTGAASNNATSNNGNGNIDKPVDITNDYNGNLYVLGTTMKSPTNTDWKLIKYDTTLTEMWVETWGSIDSLVDEPTGITIDNLGQLILTGYTTKANGGKDAVIVRYALDSTLLWQRRISAIDPTKEAMGNDVVVGLDGYIYVAGKMSNGSNDDYLTTSFTTDGVIRWLKTYNDTIGSKDVAGDVQVDNDGNVFVSGTRIAGDTQYVTIMYEQYQRNDSAIYDTFSVPRYLQNQVIVRFSKEALEPDAINNRKKVFGNTTDFLTTDAYNELNSKLSCDFRASTMIKIFPELTLADTIMITRSGDTLRAPDFYTAFLVIYPDTGIDEQEVCDSLNHCFPLVQYAHKNSLATLQGNPPDDPEYDLGGTGCNQGGLADSTLFPGSTNVEAAWNLEVGNPNIRVGVVDAAIDGYHEDFGGTPTSFLAGKVQGWDFQNNMDEQLFESTQAGQPHSNHGTAMAGTIGAIRNNTLGISGIAGGDLNDNGNVGVSLYSIRAWDDAQGWVDAATIARAIYHSAQGGHDSLQGIYYHYAVAIMNNSYAFTTPYPPPFTPDFVGASYNRVTLLRDAVHAVNREGVIFVASRGEGHSNALTFPACYEDSWVLNISGSDLSGNWEDNNTSPRDFGGGIDLIAPSVTSLSRTTTYNLVSQTSNYVSSNGTSTSAAYVSGVSALLLSYYENPALAPGQILYPEDVEYLLERSASIPQFYDPEYVGAGRLNAAGLLNLVQKPKRKVIHVANSSTTNATTTLLDTAVLIKLAEPLSVFNYPIEYTDTMPWIYMDTGLYKMDVYKYKEWIKHSIPLGDSIVGYWPVHSQSVIFGRYDSISPTLKILKPYEKCYIDSMRKDSALVSGYLYHVKDAVADTFIRWLPGSSVITHPTLSYSLLVDSPIILNIHDTENALGATLYPNPSTDISYLRVEVDNGQNVSVQVFDVLGNLINTVFDEFIIDSKSIPIVTKSFQSGVYFITITTQTGSRKTLPLCKL